MTVVLAGEHLMASAEHEVRAACHELGLEVIEWELGRLEVVPRVVIAGLPTGARRIPAELLSLLEASPTVRLILCTHELLVRSRYPVGDGRVCLLGPPVERAHVVTALRVHLGTNREPEAAAADRFEMLRRTHWIAWSRGRSGPPVSMHAYGGTTLLVGELAADEREALAEEMGVTIKEIAKNAASAARVATGAVSSAQRTNELVVKLGESSTEIGNVLKVITTIAEQTNLLALNATIEAARAGEAGKGFAVVANEVKELAKETAKATEEITRKIAAIQSDATSAIAAITEITQVIGEINDIQNTIASSVEEQAATTNEISRNIHELAQASGEIAQNVTTVATAAGETADCSTQTRAAASELADLSRRLDAQMSQFTYEDGPMTARELPRTHTTSGTIVRIPMPANVIPRSRNTSTGYSH